MTSNLFDRVRLKEELALGDGVHAPAGTLGSIVGVRAQLLVPIEEMPEVLLEEVRDFAEFIQQRKLRVTQVSE
ncbi:MAG: DUF2281 domain-containing protein [Cyanothece sp. SIO1E1]|nr:DUF2281 domain-containing protein [Cyanothece sp. SIO1E1]